MDVVSIVTSVVAFAEAALKSTKFVYQTLSTVKHQPRLVQSLVTAIRKLHLVLRKVSKSPAVRFARERADLEALSTIIRLCQEDCKRYENTIQRIQIVRNDSLVGRAWKQVKTILKEKELEKIWTEVNLHVDVIEVNIGLLLTSYVQRNSTQIQHHSSKLDTVHDQVEELREDSTQRHAELRKELDLLNAKVERMEGMSRNQLEHIFELLRSFRERLSQGSPSIQANACTNKQRRCDVSKDVRAAEPLTEYEKVLSSIDRLCKLSTQEEDISFNGDTQEIIDDLEALLESISEQMLYEVEDSKGSHTPELSRKETPPFNTCDLKYTKGLLTCADSIQVNKASSATAIPKQTRIVQEQQMKKLMTVYGTFTLTTRRRQLFREDAESASREKEFIAMLTVMLDHPRLNNATLNISFHQRAKRDGFFSFSPRLCVGIVHERGAEVFEYVRRGNMKGFLTMLQKGEATVWDHDTHGVPLLNYALEQPAMTKFLIEAGVDIDENVMCKKLEYDMVDQDSGAATRTECRKLLLEAGADPTIPHKFGVGPQSRRRAIGNIWAYPDPQGLQCLLDLDPGFIDIKTGLVGEDSFMRHIAPGIESPPCNLAHWIELLKTLSERGMDINGVFQVDHENMELPAATLMHDLLSAAKPCQQNCCKEILKFLLSNGANLSTRDERGITVMRAGFDEKYHEHEGQVGGFKGDLWDSILTEYGYDIAELRKAYCAPRKPWYDQKHQNYSRQDFEKLWCGMEHLCPYWYDPPSWPPNCPEDPRMFSLERRQQRGSVIEQEVYSIDDEDDASCEADEEFPIEDSEDIFDEQDILDLYASPCEGEEDIRGEFGLESSSANAEG